MLILIQILSRLCSNIGKMRKILIASSVFFFVCVLFMPTANAQRRKVPNLKNFDLAPYHFGFELGINQMLFTVKTYPNFQHKMYYNTDGKIYQMPDLSSDSARVLSIEGQPTFGFIVGLIGNLRLTDHSDLRFTPNLTFGERRLVYTFQSWYNGKETAIVTKTKGIQSTFVEFPLYLKYKGDRIQNIRPYVTIGAKYAIDVSSNAKKKDTDSNKHVFLNRNDLYGDLGVGFDVYTAFFKFGTEIHMSYGFRDVLKRDGTIYTDPVRGLNSKLFEIMFTFE